MNSFPNEITLIIIKKINNIQTLLNIKFCSQDYNVLISNFIIKKLILSKRLFNYKPFTKSSENPRTYDCCINEDCYWDTIDIYEDIYNPGYSSYCHFTQEAENCSTMTINNKIYNVNTPYCCECFSTYVLIGDNKKVRHNHKIDTINIDYL